MLIFAYLYYNYTPSSGPTAADSLDARKTADLHLLSPGQQFHDLAFGGRGEKAKSTAGW